jgi:hypothetical protein
MKKTNEAEMERGKRNSKLLHCVRAQPCDLSTEYVYTFDALEYLCAPQLLVVLLGVRDFY